MDGVRLSTMVLDMLLSHVFIQSSSDSCLTICATESESKGLKLACLGSYPDAVDTAETLGEAANTATEASVGVGGNPVAGVPNHSSNVSDTEIMGLRNTKLAWFIIRLEESVLLSSAC